MREFLEPLTVQRFSGGLGVWSVKPLEVPRRVQEILRSLARPAGSDVEVLKRSPRRSVLRVWPFSTRYLSLIVKGFPLAKIESRIKYKKYGLSEFIHHRAAQQRGLEVPDCHAYFEVRSLGMVAANGVLIEDLRGWSSLAELIQANPSRQAELIARTIPFFRKLYDAGVNHIDPGPQNFLLGPDKRELRLIDWQYCSLVAPRQLSQLLLQAAHFLHYANLPAQSPETRAWLEQLAKECDPALSPETLRRAVASLQARGKISATERLALKLDEQTAQIVGLPFKS